MKVEFMSGFEKDLKDIHRTFVIEKGNTGLDFISKMKQ
jgi:hypothetical protein